MEYQTEKRYHMTAADLAELKVVGWSIGTEATPCAPGEVRWSSDNAVPHTGDVVYVSMNGFGWCTVNGYFIEWDFLGLYCQPLTPSKWWLKQNPERRDCMIFGAEIDFDKR